MKHGTLARCSAALVALTLWGAACSTSDDVVGVEEIAETAQSSDEPADDTTTDAPEPTDSEPGEVDDEAADDEAADDVGDGFTFVSPDGDYTITFPGEPTSTPLPVALPTGEVTAEAFIYEDGTDAAYFTSVFEYAEGTTDGDAEVVLVGARDGAVENVGGSLVESEFVETGGIPGVAFSFSVAGGEGEALVYFEDDRLYQSFALGASGQSDAFTAFLDSFMFTASVTSDTAAGDS